MDSQFARTRKGRWRYKPEVLAEVGWAVRARFEQRQRLAIRDEIAVLIDDARATHRTIKTTVEADRLRRGYPDGGLSRDQIELSIIDVAGVADVVVELGGQNGQE